MANELRSAILRVSSAEEQGFWPEAGRAFRNLVLRLVLRIVALGLAVLHNLIAERPSGDGQKRRAAPVRIALCAVSCGQVLNAKRIGLPGEPRHAGAAFPCTDDGDGGERRSTPVNTVAHRRRREIILPDYAAASLRPIRHGEKQMLRSFAQDRKWLKEILAGATLRAIAAGERRIERIISMQLTLAFLDLKLVRAALHGSLPRGMSTRRLIDASMSWPEQWWALGLSRPA